MKCPLCSSNQIESWCAYEEILGLYWTCAECKLIWLDEARRPAPGLEEARYREHNNDVNDPGYMAYLGRTAQPVVQRLRAPARGLDYGCGPTEGMKALLSAHQFSVESYDPIFFPRADLLKNRYDFVLCSEAAEHFFQPGAEFARFATLVREGGWLSVRSQLAVPREKFSQWWYRKEPTHVTFYRSETVRWIAQRWGWELVELDDPIWLLRKLA